MEGGWGMKGGRDVRLSNTCGRVALVGLKGGTGGKGPFLRAKVREAPNDRGRVWTPEPLRT